LNASGRRVLSAGHLDIGKRRPADGNAVFEIGSITKAFTALLLADMTMRGEVRLEDRVLFHLAPGTKVPERNGRAITLLDLATHTAGLPFMPETASATVESAAAARRRLGTTRISVTGC
jgi:serine-type D-Ala-D-Ala carboxypeptidase/endopeptidase